MLWLALGVGFGASFIAVMGQHPVERRYRYAAVGLIVAAVVYEVFAATRGTCAPL